MPRRLGRRSTTSLPRARAGDPPLVHARAEREFNALFIGVVQGELVPYASYYRTGFLTDRPLAALRADPPGAGAGAGARRVGAGRPHRRAVRGHWPVLIREGADPAVQWHMLDSHLAPWAGRFFQDLERAESADFYRPVGTVGRPVPADRSRDPAGGVRPTEPHAGGNRRMTSQPEPPRTPASAPRHPEDAWPGRGRCRRRPPCCRPATAAQAAETPQEQVKTRYRETEHVKRFYALNRL